MKSQFLWMALFAFLGGVAGSLTLGATQSYAAKREQSFYTTNFYNDDGKRIGVIGAHPGAAEGILFVFNGNGQPEVQLGAYGEGSEKGQSLFGMHDRNGHLRLLMRMYGPKDSPTVVMKDSAGMDRIVFGLDGQTQEPFFRYRDRNGVDRDLIADRTDTDTPY